MTATYAPPPFPPPPLEAQERVPFPQPEFSCMPNWESSLYPEQGWATLDLPTELRTSIEDLLQASKSFFAQPQPDKQKWIVPNADTEEGFFAVPGEKEYITLRTVNSGPADLVEHVSKCWTLAGKLFLEMLRNIERSLEMTPDALTRFAEPCEHLDKQRRATMLRLFRYEIKEDEASVVSEPHNDLGLLSLVCGDVPGLEVFDKELTDWYPIELAQTIRPTASVLSGQQLNWLTNTLYQPGGHRVVALPFNVPLETPGTPQYRYSIVFILRAHWPVTINTDSLTTRITGPFISPMKDKPIYELFKKIVASHYNVNAGKEEREAQRKKLDEERLAFKKAQAES